MMCVGSAMAQDRAGTMQAIALAPMALNSYSIPPATIGSAKVLDLEGDMIGRVAKIRVAALSKPEGLDIWLSASGKTISVAASNISYDELQNTVTLGIGRNQLGQPPGATAATHP